MLQDYLSNIGAFDYAVICYGLLIVIYQLSVMFLVAIRRKRKLSASITSKLKNTGLVLSELLPLAGLLGTVLAMLSTFVSMKSGVGDVGVTISKFAPAITTTASGLFLLVPNLLLNAVIDIMTSSESGK